MSNECKHECHIFSPVQIKCQKCGNIWHMRGIFTDATTKSPVNTTKQTEDENTMIDLMNTTQCSHECDAYECKDYPLIGRCLKCHTVITQSECSNY